jgi:hypothetical protein
MIKVTQEQFDEAIKNLVFNRKTYRGSEPSIVVGDTELGFADPEAERLDFSGVKFLDGVPYVPDIDARIVDAINKGGRAQHGAVPRLQDDALPCRLGLQGIRRAGPQAGAQVRHRDCSRTDLPRSHW